MEKRDNFSSKLGFVLAAAGSAVGLGNLWRFPYLVAQYGGGIFLLVYLILAVTFGYSLMTLEISLGRKTAQSPIGAYKAYGHAWVGWLAVIIPTIILGYYSVIGGWVFKYIAVFVSGSGPAAAADGYFSGFISGTWEPIVYALLFTIAGFVILIGGIKGGIEKASRFLMPLLLAISVFIAVYNFTLPGAWEGIKYILIPDFSRFGLETIIGAVGQLFYSMSLAMGIMITYGSYLGKKSDIEKCVSNIEIFDTVIAFLAAFMIIPSVFIFNNGDPEKLNQGAGLMFITLPKVFDSLPLGEFVGAAFFILVAFAALTSYISIAEVLISTFCDVFGIKRKFALIIALCISLAFMFPATLGYGIGSGIKFMDMQILDLMDFFSNSLLLPLEGLASCMIFGYAVGLKPIIDEVELSSKFKRKKLFTVVIKGFAPPLLALIVISNILQILGVISI